MVMKIYKRAFTELMKKPFRLWGITLLAALFAMIGYTLGGPVLAIGIGVSILLQASLANVYLKSYIGGEQIHVVDLFVTFKDWNTIKRVLFSISWGALWKYLWLLIPIAGPIFFIIKHYEYALIPYIVMDKPETGITDCKEESSKMTNGYKGQMFLADILVFVFYFVVVLVLMLLSKIPYVGVVFAIILVLFYICFILIVGLFVNIVHASFYEEIKNATNGGDQYTAPVEPQIAAPAQPQVTAPAQPQNAAPAEPQVAAPAEPQNTAPQAPQNIPPQQ